MSDILIKGMEMPKGRPVCIVIDAAGQARRYDYRRWIELWWWLDHFCEHEPPKWGDE